MSAHRPAAVHDRGIGRRRQEHADRTAPVRHQAGPRGSTRAGGRGAPASQQRRWARPRAPHRRPARRARAGHHDRRRLPLLRDRSPPIHHRRLPGHKQYTRNMVTGASTADLSIVLIDARKGVLEQSKRHAYISALLGIPHLVVCVNKMDLVDFREERVHAHRRRDPRVPRAVAVARGDGDPDLGTQRRQRRGPFGRDALVRGPTLLEHLETVEIEADHPATPMRFPVQWVFARCGLSWGNGASAPVTATRAGRCGYRGYAGQLASGVLHAGRRRARAARAASARASRRSTPSTGSATKRSRRCRSRSGSKTTWTSRAVI